MDIIDAENPHGVIVSTGGQIPNNLAMYLDEENVPILGTSAKDIDNAEDRAKFSSMLTENGINQPEWSALTSMDDIDKFVDRVGFPVLVRPSYVLSGAAMNICSNRDELTRFLQLAANVSEDHPVVVSKFIEHAKEIEMDAVAQDGEILAYAISEHIEFAGVQLWWMLQFSSHLRNFMLKLCAVLSVSVVRLRRSCTSTDHSTSSLWHVITISSLLSVTSVRAVHSHSLVRC